MRDGQGFIANDRPIEASDQPVHACIEWQMKIIQKKLLQIDPPISQILSRIIQGWNKVSGETLVFPPFDHCDDLVIIVDDQGILRPIESELMDGRADLGGKCKIGGCRILVFDNHSHFVKNVALPDTPEKWARKPVGDDQQLIAGQKFRYLADAVANDVL